MPLCLRNAAWFGSSLALRTDESSVSLPPPNTHTQFKAWLLVFCASRKLCILPTQCIYTCHMVLRTNIKHFPKQHSSVGVCTGDSLCFLWANNWIFRCLHEFYFCLSHIWHLKVVHSWTIYYLFLLNIVSSLWVVVVVFVVVAIGVTWGGAKLANTPSVTFLLKNSFFLDTELNMDT